MFAIGFSAVFLLFLQTITYGESRPLNVLFLIVDDLNTDLGVYGNPWVQTPNIDSLINSGVRFDNAHVSFTACGPSRAAWLTGRRSDAIRIWDFRERNFRRNNPNLITMPGAFRSAGYKTMGIGKIVDGRNFELTAGGHDTCANAQDTKCSWDHYISVEDLQNNDQALCGTKLETFPGSGGISSRAHFTSYKTPNDLAHKQIDACITRVGQRYLQELSNSSAFFLAIGWILPHLPWVAPQRFFDLYERINQTNLMLQPDIADDVYFWFNQSSAASRYQNYEIDNYRDSSQLSTVDRIRSYMASVSFIDHEIGEVLRSLETLGSSLRDNTVIVFWSDHGFHLGEHGLWGKWTLFEEATRIPFAIVPPRNYLLNAQLGHRIARNFGKSVKAPVESVDIFPTLIDICEIESSQELAGVSLVPLLENTEGFARAAAITQVWSRDRGQNSMGYSIRTMKYRFILYTSRFNKEERNLARLPYGAKSNLRSPFELYSYQESTHELRNCILEPSCKNISNQLMQLWNDNNDRNWIEIKHRMPPDYISLPAKDVVQEEFQGFFDSLNYFDVNATKQDILAKANELFSVGVFNSTWNSKKLHLMFSIKSECDLAALKVTRGINYLLPTVTVQWSCENLDLKDPAVYHAASLHLSLKVKTGAPHTTEIPTMAKVPTSAYNTSYLPTSLPTGIPRVTIQPFSLAPTTSADPQMYARSTSVLILVMPIVTVIALCLFGCVTICLRSNSKSSTNKRIYRYKVFLNGEGTLPCNASCCRKSSTSLNLTDEAKNVYNQKGGEHMVVSYTEGKDEVDSSSKSEKISRVLEAPESSILSLEYAQNTPKACNTEDSKDEADNSESSEARCEGEETQGELHLA